MPPTNDNFADAYLISGSSGTSPSFVIDDATAEVGEPRGSDWNAVGPFQTIWFQWSCPETRLYNFNTQQSTGDVGSSDSTGHLDTRLAIWTGNSLATLVETASNDDQLLVSSQYWSNIDFEATAGQTYYIQVDTYGSPYIGEVILSWSETIEAPTVLEKERFSVSGTLTHTPDVLPRHNTGNLIVLAVAVEDDFYRNNTGWMPAPIDDDGNPITSDIGPSVFDDIEQMLYPGPPQPTLEISDDSWEELTELRIAHRQFPWDLGAYAKIWTKTATSFDEPIPTITKDLPRKSLSLIFVVVAGTPIDSIDIFGQSMGKPFGPDLQNVTSRPSVTDARPGRLPYSSTFVLWADTPTPSAYAHVNSGAAFSGAGFGTARCFGMSTIGDIKVPGDNLSAPYPVMSDNTSWKGTHYAPGSILTILFYASIPEYDRRWHVGVPSADEWMGGQPAWDGGRYFYVLGECDSSAPYNHGIFRRYDIGSDSWTTLTPPPGVHRWGHSSAVVNGKVYIFCGSEGSNGATASTDTRTTRIYDIDTDTWSTGATMPPWRVGQLVGSITSGQTSFTVNEDTSDLFSSEAAPYNADNDIWIDNESLWVRTRTHVSGTTYTYSDVSRARRGTSAAAHNDGAQVSGGAGFDIVDGYLELSSAIPYGNKIYIGGGYGMGTNTSVDNAFWEYDTVTDQFTQLTRMPAGQDFGNPVLVEDKIHFIGTNIDGIDDADPSIIIPINTLYTIPGDPQLRGHQVYDIGTDTWTVLPNIFAADAGLNEYGRDVEPYMVASVLETETNEIVSVIYQNTGENGPQNYDNDKMVLRYRLSDQVWYTDYDQDSRHSAVYFNHHGTGSFQGRYVFMFDERVGVTDTSFLFPSVLYYDIPASAYLPLSTVATIDHDLLIGVESDQHHSEIHHLESILHTGGFLYKTGTNPTISDSDMVAIGVTPANGQIAVTYNTTYGITLVWTRIAGSWIAAEASI